MSWHICKLVYEVRSPVHIGFHDLGIIQRTRYYIPGKCLWGVATSKLTRTLYRNPNPSNYQKVGEFLKRNVIFSYFFPSFDGVETYLPSYRGGFNYESANSCIPDDELEYRIASSYGSTAIESRHGVAEEGSLHETELILSTPRNSDEKLKFVGYALWRIQNETFNGVFAIATPNDLKILGSNGAISFVGQILNRIQIGGGRQYGYGELLNNLCDEQVGPDTGLWGRFPCVLSSAEVQIIVKDKQPVPGHLMDRYGKLEMVGDIEPLVGRDWDNIDNRGAGRLTSFRGVGFKPGSFILNGEIHSRMCYDGVFEIL